MFVDLQMRLLRAFCLFASVLLLILAFVALAYLIIPSKELDALEESFRQFDGIAGTAVFIPALFAIGLAKLVRLSPQSSVDVGVVGSLVYIGSAAVWFYLSRKLRMGMRWPCLVIFAFNALSIYSMSGRTHYVLSLVSKGSFSTAFSIVFVVCTLSQWLAFAWLSVASLWLLIARRENVSDNLVEKGG